MSRRLTEQLNSRYVEAANRLRPRGTKKRVVAYVESYDDVLFWRTLLDEFESDTLRFEVMLPSRTTLGKGKKNVLMNELGDRLGECMIACVDADYDYLMQGATEASRLMLNNPYVFHTYVYAIENYQCYAPGLHRACVMATLNDREVINLEAFMEEFSRIVWPLFVWNIWCYRHDCYHRFSLMDFCSLVSFREVSLYHPEQTLERIRRQCNRRMATLQQKYPEGKKSYVPLREELLRLGVRPETTYLYMQGHGLFDGVVMPLLGPVCTALRREREREIKQLACHEQQRQNELSCYRHGQGAIDMMLRKGDSYTHSEPYQRLRDDLRDFVEKLRHNSRLAVPEETVNLFNKSRHSEDHNTVSRLNLGVTTDRHSDTISHQSSEGDTPRQS